MRCHQHAWLFISHDAFARQVQGRSPLGPWAAAHQQPANIWRLERLYICGQGMHAGRQESNTRVPPTLWEVWVGT